jgi:hypothetical protein
VQYGLFWCDTRAALILDFFWHRDQCVQILSYLLGIYKALQLLFKEPAAADAWLRRPNDAPLFGGRSALDRMLSGQVSDLFLVRQYLDAERG